MTDRKPLSNRTVLITRTAEGNRAEREKLDELGADVVELATIGIAPPTSKKKLDSAIKQLDKFDWIVFTSSNGVTRFFQSASNKRAMQFFESSKGEKTSWPKFACVGPSTRKTLESLGYSCSLEPRESLTEKLGIELAKAITPEHNRVLLARAEEANRAINLTLKKAGAKISDVPVYRTVSVSRRFSKSTLEKVTDITLTSPSTVAGLLRSITAKMILSNSIKVHCIGPVTAKAAKAKGLRVSSVARNHTIEGLVESLIRFDS